MNKKLFLVIAMICALVPMSRVSSKAQSTEITGTIYINADGSISPSTAPIYTSDNETYTLTSNVSSSGDGIIIERDNITLDGAGYTLEGIGSGVGIFFEHRSNVTIKNMEITAFPNDIFVRYSTGNSILGNAVTNSNNAGIDLAWCTNNSVLRNYASNNTWGVDLLYSANNSIIENNVTNNLAIGINLYGSSSSDNIVLGNNVANNFDGIDVEGSNNTLTGNSIAHSGHYGLGLWLASNTTISGNNLSSNRLGDYIYNSSNTDMSENTFINDGPTFYGSYQNSIETNNIIATNYTAIYLDSSFSNSVNANNITANAYNGIELFFSSSNNVTQNNILENGGIGIEVYSSSNNSITRNRVTANNLGGIGFENSSSHNDVSQNNIRR